MENTESLIDEAVEGEKGASMLEYALLAALIAVICITAVSLLGEEASEAFNRIATAIGDANDQGS